MSEFVERWVLVPGYKRNCDCCRQPMPAIARFSLIAHAFGWRFYGYVWLCSRHRNDDEVRKRIDADMREFARKREEQTLDFGELELERRGQLVNEMTRAKITELARATGRTPPTMGPEPARPHSTPPAAGTASRSGVLQPAAEKAFSAVDGKAFGMVIVVAEESAFPLAEQLEQKLIRQIATQPRYPLTTDVKITSLRAPELPAETREAIQSVVWNLQTRYGKRGGRWQADFYPTPIGVIFLVVYLE